MNDLNLQPNESVILSQENILLGNLGSVNTYSLYLTNYNIIVVKKGPLRRVKSVDKYPIHMIKKFNGLAQVEAKKGPGSYPHLTIYFIDEILNATSPMWNMEVVNNWVKAINALITGDMTTLRNLNTNIETSEWDGFFRALNDMKNSFKRNLNDNNCGAANYFVRF